MIWYYFFFLPFFLSAGWGGSSGAVAAMLRLLGVMCGRVREIERKKGRGERRKESNNNKDCTVVGVTHLCLWRLFCCLGLYGLPLFPGGCLFCPLLFHQISHLSFCLLIITIIHSNCFYYYYLRNLKLRSSFSHLQIRSHFLIQCRFCDDFICWPCH